MDLNKAIQSRKSVRKFTSEKPDWRDIIECIDSARYAPLAGEIPTLKFILISDKEKIKMISEASQQDFISEAHYVVAVVSKPDLTIKSFGERGEIYARQQAGASIQNFLLSLEEKKLATCWIGYFVEKQIKELLKIPDNANVEAIFPIGYEMRKQKISKKPSLDSCLFFDKFGNKKMSGTKRLDV